MVSQEVSLTHADLRLNPGADHLLEGSGIFKSPEILKESCLILIIF